MWKVRKSNCAYVLNVKNFIKFKRIYIEVRVNFLCTRTNIYAENCGINCIRCYPSKISSYIEAPVLNIVLKSENQCCGSESGTGAFLTPGSGIWDR
jgi:hypothetical protein